MSEKPFSYSMPGFVRMGMSLAAPLLIPANAHSCMDEKFDLKPETMTTESLTSVEKWVCRLPEQAADREKVSVTLAAPEQLWSGKDERRFVALARKEALGTISKNDLASLEQLSTQRDLLKGRLTFKEIMFRRRQAEAELRLLAAARDYLSVSNPYGRPRH